MSYAESVRIEQFCPASLPPNKHRTARRASPTQPGIYCSSGGTTLVPAQLENHHVNRGVLIVPAPDFLEFCRQVRPRVFCESDPESITIPRIAQRVPVAARRKAIQDGWVDTDRTFNGKTESIDIFVFGSSILNHREILLTDSSVVALGDGAGRATAALELFDAGPDNLLTVRDIHFQLNIDTSGDPSRMLKDFLSHNRDPKRITKGTQLGTEAALIDCLDQRRVVSLGATLLRDCRAKKTLEPAYVVRALFERLSAEQDTRTVLRLLPWRYEGQCSQNPYFQGSRSVFAGGTSASIVTALAEVLPDVRRRCGGMSLDDLVEVLWAGFESFYSLCRGISGKPDEVRSSRFNSTLSLKLQVTLLSYFHQHLGKPGFARSIQSACEHYRRHHPSEFTNLGNFQHIGLEEFYRHNKWFRDASFNSGLTNTGILLRQMRAVCSTLPS